MRASIEAALLDALRREPVGATFAQLSLEVRSHFSVGSTLMSLERRGEVVSAWADGPFPRRRVYHLAPHLR